MDGMNNLQNRPITRHATERTRVVLLTAAYIAAMLILTFALQAFGWTPPVDAVLMGP